MTLKRDLRKVYLRAAEMVLDPPAWNGGFACNAITAVIIPPNSYYAAYVIPGLDARTYRISHEKFAEYFGRSTAYWWGFDQTPKSQHERALALCLMAEIIKDEDLGRKK